MLSRIFIQNFALIQSLEIDLQAGLQVITGETGAGKSIILGALRLILGERADIKAVHNSDSKSVVEAEFYLPEIFTTFFSDNDLDYEEHTVIRREILPTGKSRAFINDVPVTLETLKKLSSRLIDIHSQFETSTLLLPEYQFAMIDGLSANKSLLTEYQEGFRSYRKLRQDLISYRQQLENGSREQDYRNFLLGELDSANLDDVDLTDLQDKLRRQENAEAITENLALIFAKTDQEELGLLDQMLDIKNRLAKIGTLSHEFSHYQERFEENFLDFKDLLFDLQNEAEKVMPDPEVLQTLNERLNQINALLLKHHVNSTAELCDLRESIRQEQTGFQNLEFTISQAEKQLAAAEKTLEKLSKELSKSRKTAVPDFVNKIEGLLRRLGLEKARIAVELTPSQEFNRFGKEEIQLLFQANAGFPLKPIHTAISGGERSRVMLSIKKIMAENAELPTLILDEIDTGVSGKVAEEMGNVMKDMADDMQLIVITHLAQVAAKGNNNYKVVKEEIGGKMQSTIIPLSEEEKLQEIAQLLSGSHITAAAVSQAKELMK